MPTSIPILLFPAPRAGASTPRRESAFRDGTPHRSIYRVDDRRPLAPSGNRVVARRWGGGGEPQHFGVKNSAVTLELCDVKLLE
jgi:hypothetical protein